MILTAITCLALNIFHESRGQPIDGQIAVAQVTYNRANQNPDNVCKVVFQPYQFSWTNGIPRDKKSGMPKSSPKLTPKDIRSWEIAVAIAEATFVEGALHDVVGDATHFRNIREAKKWYADLRFVKQIGGHRFYKQV